MSGYFPAQHGVKYTLETDMPSPQYPQVELATSFKNPATVVAAAGYTPVYKGKFHCIKPANGSTWVPDRRQPVRLHPLGSAGCRRQPGRLGGGRRRQRRALHELPGHAAAGTEGALQYLTTGGRAEPAVLHGRLAGQPPRRAVLPEELHQRGYDNSWLQGEIEPPATANEDLSTKPSVQAEFLQIFNLSGPIPTPQMKRNYLNFYGNLMKSSDAYLVKILDTLTSTGLLDNTLVIATADHGEMGTSHGGMRQKNFNFYEEAMRVPLVYSNPRLFRSPDDRRAGLPRRLPADAGQPGRRAGRAPAPTGRGSTTPIRSSTGPPKPPQDYTVFTYDDYQSGQANGPYPQPPNHVVSIREQRYKLARYYDANGKVPAQWEMYDLKPIRSSAQPRLQALQAHARAGAPVPAAAAQAHAGRADAAQAAELSAWRRRQALFTP